MSIHEPYNIISQASLFADMDTELTIDSEWIQWITRIMYNSVATKIENGPKTNTKILRFLKIDRRQYEKSSLIRKFFEYLRRLQIL